jgi:hypothetical protein
MAIVGVSIVPLPQGALAMFDLPENYEGWYAFRIPENEWGRTNIQMGRWEPVHRDRRALIDTTIDVAVDPPEPVPVNAVGGALCELDRQNALSVRLPEWLASPQIRDVPDCTLVFAVRANDEVEGTRFIIGGMALFPLHNREAIVDVRPLRGCDPAQLILEWCRGMHRAPNYHPALGVVDWNVGIQGIRETGLSSQHVQEAKERSLALLRSCLTPAQLEEFDRTKTFHVSLPNGRLFLVQNRYAYSVSELREQINDGFVERVPIMDYCVITGNHDIPLYDQMLVQKLALEAAPDEFFRVANVMGPRPVPDLDMIMEFREAVREAVEAGPVVDVNFEDILANRPAYVRPRRQGLRE